MGEDGVKGMKIQKTRNSHCGVKKKNRRMVGRKEIRKGRKRTEERREE